MSDETCRSCDLPASGAHGLPVDENGDIVAVTYVGVWNGVPACKSCYDVHLAAGVNGPEVLTAYLEATEDIRRRLFALAALVDQMHTTAKQGGLI